LRCDFVDAETSFQFSSLKKGRENYGKPFGGIISHAMPSVVAYTTAV